MEELNKTQKPFMSRASLIRCLTLSLLSALMYGGGYFGPPLGIVARMFSPTPLALLGVRENTEWMTVGILGAVVVLYFFLGPLPSLYFLAGEGLLSLGLALSSKKVQKGSEALLLCTAVAVISKVLIMVLEVARTGSNPFMPEVETLKSIMLQMYSEIPGQNAEGATAFMKSAEQAIALAPYMLPSLVVMSSVFDSFLNYRLCEALQRKRGPLFPPLPSFENWIFPKNILGAFVLAFMLPLLTGENPDPVWTMLELNLKFLINVLFFIQGLSLLWWWLLKRGAHFLLRLFIAVLLTISGLGMWTIALGVADVCLDLRVRSLKKKT